MGIKRRTRGNTKSGMLRMYTGSERGYMIDDDLVEYGTFERSPGTQEAPTRPEDSGRPTSGSSSSSSGDGWQQFAEFEAGIYDAPIVGHSREVGRDVMLFIGPDRVPFRVNITFLNELSETYRGFTGDTYEYPEMAPDGVRISLDLMQNHLSGTPIRSKPDDLINHCFDVWQVAESLENRWLKQRVLDEMAGEFRIDRIYRHEEFVGQLHQFFNRFQSDQEDIVWSTFYTLLMRLRAEHDSISNVIPSRGHRFGFNSTNSEVGLASNTISTEYSRVRRDCFCNHCQKHRELAEADRRLGAWIQLRFKTECLRVIRFLSRFWALLLMRRRHLPVFILAFLLVTIPACWFGYWEWMKVTVNTIESVALIHIILLLYLVVIGILMILALIWRCFGHLFSPTPRMAWWVIASIFARKKAIFMLLLTLMLYLIYHSVITSQFPDWDNYRWHVEE